MIIIISLKCNVIITSLKCDGIITSQKCDVTLHGINSWLEYNVTKNMSTLIDQRYEYRWALSCHSIVCVFSETNEPQNLTRFRYLIVRCSHAKAAVVPSGTRWSLCAVSFSENGCAIISHTPMSTWAHSVVSRYVLVLSYLCSGGKVWSYCCHSTVLSGCMGSQKSLLQYEKAIDGLIENCTCQLRRK